MASWPDWSLGLPEEITRFVVPREAVRLGLRPRSAGDLRDDPPALVNEIYERLRACDLGYTSTVIGHTGNQSVQTPQEVLDHRTPNCVDMATLFAGVCLACDLVPLVMLVTKADNTRHALVCVAPRAVPRTRTSFDLGPVGGSGHIERNDPEACAELMTVAAAEGWIPVETTGVCRTTLWSNGGSTPTSLDFADATRVASVVLAGARRIDLVDVHRLQADGLHPYRPRSPVPHPAVAVVLAAVVVVVVVVAVAWNPWSSDEVTARRMTGVFNIAIAELVGADDGLGLARQVAVAVEAALPEGRGFQVMGPDDVGSTTPVEAPARAEELGADVLVHGTLERSPGSTTLYLADFEVHTSRHTDATPFPLSFDEQFAATVSSASIDAGLAASETSIRSFIFTLDGLAALLADQYDMADERLADAAAVMGTRGPPALVTTLQAWSLLVRASVHQEPRHVERARELAIEAREVDPDSEFAILTDLAAGYLSIVPPGTPEIHLTCDVPQERPAAPEQADVEELTQTVSETVVGLSTLGRIQGASLLGRLEVAMQVARAELGEAPDFGRALGIFEGVVADVEATDESAVLGIWASDAHRWLGRLTQSDPSSPAALSARHFATAAALGTPLWAARDYALAGQAQLCRPGGSHVEAACLFELAARHAHGLAPREEERYLAASHGTGATCPGGWEPAV